MTISSIISAFTGKADAPTDTRGAEMTAEDRAIAQLLAAGGVAAGPRDLPTYLNRMRTHIGM